MGQAADWQSPYFSNVFELYDRADFAQEFLRRNPAYRAAYGPAARTGRLAALARRWGLVFRLRP